MGVPSIQRSYGSCESTSRNGGEANTVLKAYKYRLYPNRATEKKLSFVLNRCREVYNAALSERKDAYQQYRRTTVIAGQERTVAATMVTGHQVKPISFYGQKRDLVEIKQERPEYQDIASHVLQDVLNRLDKAFSAFFRRVRNGETPGYPRFKGRNRYDSFTYPDRAGWKFDGWYLHLSKIGSIKVKLHRPLGERSRPLRSSARSISGTLSFPVKCLNLRNCLCPTRM
jgi:putative transposase